MSVAYISNPPLRYPSVEPLYHESYLDAQTRLRHLIDLYRRVDYVKPVVDDGPPKAKIHIRLKMKRLLREGERLARIEKDNRFLLSKILTVMREPAHVDHYHKTPLPAHTDTLNYPARKQMVERVNRENMAMYRRIKKTKTCYSRVQMLLQHERRLKCMQNITEVFRKWNKFAKRRKRYLFSGQFKAHGYGDIDHEDLKRRTERTHQACFPFFPEGWLQPLPVPRSSRPARGAEPVDHQRCFVPFPQHIEGWLPPRRSPYPPTGPCKYVYRENRATKLRSDMVKRQIAALAPQPVVVCSPSPTCLTKEGRLPVHETKATRLRAELVQQKMDPKADQPLSPEKTKKAKKSPTPGEKSQELQDQVPTQAEKSQELRDQVPTQPDQNQELQDQVPTQPDQSQELQDQVPTQPDQSQELQDQVPTQPDQNQELQDQVPTQPDQNQELQDQVPNQPDQNQELQDQVPNQPDQNQESQEPQDQNQSALAPCSPFPSQRDKKNPYMEHIMLDKLIPMGTTPISTRLPPLADTLQKARTKGRTGNKKQTSMHHSKQPTSANVALAPIKSTSVVKELKNARNLAPSLTSPSAAATTHSEVSSRKERNRSLQKQERAHKHSKHQQDSTRRAQDSTRRAQDPTRRAQDPTRRAQDPTRRAQDPTRRVQDPTRRVQDYTRRVQDPSRKQDSMQEVQSSTRKLQDPIRKVQDSTRNVQDPTGKMQDPTGHAHGPFTEAQDHTGKVPDPTRKVPDPTRKVPNPMRKVSEVLESIRKVSEVLDPIRKVSEVLDPTRKVSEVLDPTRKVSEVLDPIRKVPEVLDPIRKVPDHTRKMLDSTRKVMDPTRQVLDPNRKVPEVLDATRQVQEVPDPTRQVLDSTRKVLDPNRKVPEVLDTARQVLDPISKAQNSDCKPFGSEFLDTPRTHLPRLENTKSTKGGIKPEVKTKKGHGVQSVRPCKSYLEMLLLYDEAETKEESHSAADEVSSNGEPSGNKSSLSLRKLTDVQHHKDTKDRASVEEDLGENEAAECGLETSLGNKESPGNSEGDCYDHLGLPVAGIPF